MLVFGSPILLSYVERPIEQPSLPSAGRFSLLHDLVIDLLEKPGHCGHDRRLYFLQMRGQLIERSAVVYRHTVRAKYVKHGPFKDVRERQDGQRAVRRAYRQAV